MSSKTFKGMMAAIIALAAAAAFFIGLVIPVVGGTKQASDNNNVVAGNNTAETTAGNEEAAETITDSAGNEFTIPLNVSSVITLNDKAADMFAALGKDNLLTGVSDGTKYPSSAASITKYGTEETPHTENIIAAAPGAVLASADFKNSESYSKITQAGIPVICLNFDNADTAIEETAKLGLLFDAYDKADELVTDLENVKSLVRDKVAGNQGAKVYWEKSGEYTSVGKDQNETKLLTLASAVSITADKTGNEVKTDAASVKSANPDVIVKESNYDENILTLETDDIKKAEDLVNGIMKRSGIDGVNAVKNKKVIALSERITNTPLGSAIAPLYLAKIAYPDALKDVKPGDYLNELLDKYWGDSNYKGALAYAGDLTAEQNQSENVLASGESSGGSLSSLVSSYGSSGGSSLRSSLLSSSASTSSKGSLLGKANSTGSSTAKTGTTNTNKNNNNNQTNKNNKQNDVSTSKKTEKVQDSIGQDIIVNKDDGDTAIKSCIVLNSSVYEMIKIMGGANKVTGVAESLATSSNYPELSGMPTHGTFNNPNAESIIEANPDVVFAYGNYGQEAMNKVRAAGITVISLNFYMASEIEDEIVVLGKLLGNEKMAKEWNAAVLEIQQIVAARTRYVPAIRCYWEGYTDYKSVTDGSGGAEIMRLANVYNIYDANSATSYPKVSDEWVIQKNPEVMVKMVSSTKYILGNTITNYTAASALYKSLTERPGWSEISAVQKDKILILDAKVGSTALGCAVAPLYIAKVAYPDQFRDIDADAYTKAFYKKFYGEELGGTWRFSYQNLN